MGALSLEITLCLLARNNVLLIPTAIMTFIRFRRFGDFDSRLASNKCPLKT
jgi:hypothetical protein